MFFNRFFYNLMLFMLFYVVSKDLRSKDMILKL